ncbi:MAG: hypothetical protein U1B83_04510, partial [Candidatus Cloacimonadaceae bacterium]|nr:hypothetical protein [Candidatus Cloacimonadaceae bacterium]
MKQHINIAWGRLRLRMLLPLMILLLGIGILAAQTAAPESLAAASQSAAATDTVAVTPASTTAAPIAEVAPEGLFEEFNTLLRWFVVALLVISIFSAIRIWIIKKRGGGESP